MLKIRRTLYKSRNGRKTDTLWSGCSQLHHDNMSVKSIPLKPNFYIEKLGYAGVYLFFLFLLQNIDCAPTIYVLSKNKNKCPNFSDIISLFEAEKNLCILHGQVFVMWVPGSIIVRCHDWDLDIFYFIDFCR